MLHALTLDDWLTRLEAPTVITLGLDRVRQVSAAAALDPPCPVLTVGGTNGKGSTCAMLEAILRAAGYRVGLFTSPHLLRYNERVRIDGRDADDAALLDAFERIDAARGETPLTYFEFGTLAAMQCFLTAAVDVVILEVGLGGRLDAVNGWDADAALVTSVDFDHMDYLGDTVAAIAYEKAGIYRTGRPALCSLAAPPASLIAHAAAIAADLRYAGRDFQASHSDAGWTFRMADTVWPDLPPPALVGPYQQANAAGALALLCSVAARLPVPLAAVRTGLLQVRIAGRFQCLQRDPELIVDVAHNPEAARALVAALAVTPRRCLAIVGMLADKDTAGVLATVAPQIAAWWTLTPDSPRALPAAQLAAQLVALDAVVTVAENYPAALAAAREQAGPDDRILVFGSFYTVAVALAYAAAQP